MTQEMNAPKAPGTLYVVATPIGNLEDMTLRAIRILGEVDFVAAEDTRRSLQLLNHLGITKPLTSYFEHNKLTKGERIVTRLQEGESCALVSDAGCPAISDPGADLVKLCIQRGVPVTFVPGANAALGGLILSGLPTDRFVFEGFLPTGKKDRKARLEQLAREYRTAVFYEAPHKLRDTLDDLAVVLGGGRQVALARELTKRHEEVLRGTLAEMQAKFAEEDPRGEFVVVLEGGIYQPDVPAQDIPDDAGILSRYQERVAAGEDRKAVLRELAQLTGRPKRDLYALVNET